MEVLETGIEGLVEIIPRVFGDERGWFIESYNASRYKAMCGIDTEFVQDNLSSSSKGVLRGLHFQRPPMAQSKLVMCLSGRVLDVAVDIRKNSPTYGKHFRTILDAKRKNQLYIPRGFAHGFHALEDGSVFAYKCDNTYSPEHEMTLDWADPDLHIEWDALNPIISEKDEHGLPFAKFDSPF